VVAIERAVGYGDYFGEDEMLFFSSFEELVERLARLAAEPDLRMRMASAFRSRYFEKFNERNVAAHLLAVLTAERAPEDMPW
jgi:glycosyltransferase involved in cell wall biosynthesis